MTARTTVEPSILMDIGVFVNWKDRIEVVEAGWSWEQVVHRVEYSTPFILFLSRREHNSLPGVSGCSPLTVAQDV